MALTDNRMHRTLMLCLLYFAQGLPRGFLTIVFISYLTQQGMTASDTGILIAMFILPGTLKFVWGPIIDFVSFAELGRRRPWIIIAQILMAVTLLCIAFIDSPINNLAIFGWIYFLHNCFVSLQDVATDALTLEVVPEHELGRINGLMLGSKIIGTGIGTALLAWIMQGFGVTAAVVFQVVSLAMITVLPIVSLERPQDSYFSLKRNPSEGPPRKVLNLVHPIHILKDVLSLFRLRSAVAFIVFGTLISVSEGIVNVIVKPLYITQLQWTYVEFSFVSGISTILQLVAGVIGGFYADRIGRRTVMLIGYLSYGTLSILFAIFSAFWSDSWFAFSYLVVIQPATIFGSAAFFSMAMKLSWQHSAATIFSFLMAVCLAGQAFGSWFVGPLKDEFHLSYQVIFTIAGLFMIVPLILLLLVKEKEIDEARQLLY